MPGRTGRAANRPPNSPMNERRTRRLSAHALVNWTAFGALLVGVSAADITPTKMIWNASDSLPVGLYWVRNGSAKRGDLVLVGLPQSARAFAADRRILPDDTPALKRVAALKGDRVCRFGQVVSVNGKQIARAHWSDGLGRRMPVWNGCRVLKDGDVFLLAGHPKSFDGRYFGVTNTSQIIGVARPLWTYGSTSQ